MELISVTKRHGEPVALLYGAHFENGKIRAGLLFIRAGIRSQALVFKAPGKKLKLKLSLPRNAKTLKADGVAKNVLLEVLE